MCLVFHSNGHLTIKVLWEQIWLTVRDETLEILECYDLVFRFHGPATSTDRLQILSPHRPQQGEVFALSGGLTSFDWAFTATPLDPGRGRFRIDFAGPPYEAPLEFEVTRLYPRLRQTDWLAGAPPNDTGAALFWGTEMTLAEILFDDGATIGKFDPDRAGETTYWLRLAFAPRVNHLTPQPIEFGPPGKPLFFHVQPCFVLSPNQVLNLLESKLNFLAENVPYFRAGVLRAKTEIFANIFAARSTSTCVEDHRISLLTGSESLILNTSIDGECGFVGVNAVGLTPPIRLTRTWFHGAKYYLYSDPITLVRAVYKYLRNFARTAGDAKSKEAISSALSCGSHENVSHVTDALEKWGFIKCPRDGFYCIVEPPLEDDQLFLKRVEGADELDLKSRGQEFRDDLYGELSVHPAAIPPSRFRPRGFRLFFDLAFCLS